MALSSEITDLGIVIHIMTLQILTNNHQACVFGHWNIDYFIHSDQHGNHNPISYLIYRPFTLCVLTNYTDNVGIIMKWH